MSDLRIYRRSELEAIKPAIDAEGCLYRYRKIWLEGTDDTTDDALIGIAWHAVNHLYIVKLLDARLDQDAELAGEAFAEGIAQTQTPSRLIPAIRELWLWHAESFELDRDRFIAAEERGQAGDVGFTPDLVMAHPERNALEVTDFKSGWQPPLTPEALKINFQARVYSRYAYDRWPNFTQYEFTLHAVRFRKSVTVSFTVQELQAVEAEVQAAILTIQHAEATDQWPAIPGPSCHFCSLACPVADQDITLPKRLQSAQVRTFAGWLLVAEKQLRNAKKLMKAAVGIHGPVIINGIEWANRPIVQRTYPIETVMSLIRERSAFGGFEDLRISHSALQEVFRMYPELEDELTKDVKEKTVYRFGAKQPGADDDSEFDE